MKMSCSFVALNVLKLRLFFKGQIAKTKGQKPKKYCSNLVFDPQGHGNEGDQPLNLQAFI